MCVFSYLVVLNRLAGRTVCWPQQVVWYGFSLLAVLMSAGGCTLPLPYMMPAGQTSAVSAQPMPIALDKVETTAEGMRITLSGTHPFSYLLVNHDQPFQLAIDVPQARVTQPQVRTLEQGGIETIRLHQVSETPHLARLEIDLQKQATYSVAKEQEHLVVRVQAPQGQPEASLSPRDVPISTNATPNTTDASNSPDIGDIGEYKIGPGDVLAISVYDEPDLSQQRRLNKQGRLDFPLIGEVDVAGLTAAQLAKRLEDLLSPRYLRNPQVFVEVVEFTSKKVFIVGAVSTPTALTLRGETTLLEVLSQMTTGMSHSSTLTVFRRQSAPGASTGGDHHMQAIRVNLDGLLRQGDISENLVLQPQDVIYIPKPDAVFVFGEVNRTGPIPLSDGGISLIETINKAGGFSEFAAAHRTRVLRLVNGRERVIEVDMAAVIRGDLGKDITLQSNDVVIVPKSVF